MTLTEASQITLLIFILGGVIHAVWILSGLASLSNSHKERLDDHAQKIEKHDERLNAHDGRLQVIERVLK